MSAMVAAFAESGQAMPLNSRSIGSPQRRPGLGPCPGLGPFPCILGGDKVPLKRLEA
jgi:hypothetical protein